MMLKSIFEKAEPVKLTYRDYKKFLFARFKPDLQNAFKSCPISYNSLKQCLLSKLNDYAPKKAKCVRGNNKWHMNKLLRRSIMKRSKLKNKANKMNHHLNIQIFNKQRNYLVR